MRPDEAEAIANFIAARYVRASRIVEIGIGDEHSVAERLLRLLPKSRLVGIDLETVQMDSNTQVQILRDDIMNPNWSLYAGSGLLYSLRPAPEMIAHMERIATQVGADLLVRPLTGEEAGYDFRDWSPHHLGAVTLYLRGVRV